MNEWEVDIIQQVNQFTIEHTQSIGVIPGGTTGQILAKRSNANYDTEWIDPAGGVSNIITDGVDTFVDVSTGQFIDMKSNLSSGNLLTLKKDDDTEVFQVDVDGSIFNDDKAGLVYKATGSLYIGTGINHILSTGNYNNVFGEGAGISITTAEENVLIGRDAGSSLDAYDRNVIIGSRAAVDLRGERNVLIGAFSGNSLAFGENGNVFLGYASGFHQITSDKLIIGNQFYANAADEQTKSLVVADFDPDPSLQLFKLNSLLEITQMNSGATQVAAGALINEVWKTSGHATLPDNVLMIGV